MMQVISLFSGIGGFELAAEWAGWQNIVSCEINQFGRKVLDYYWPNAYHHDDIHTLTYEKIDQELTKRKGQNWRTDDIILTGGFPCQPYSAAGKRLGKDDERHLWPEMLRIIREVQPKWIVGENVLGLVNWSEGLVFEEVQADLEAEGYEVQTYVLPAAAVNAPHRRDRVWFVAYANECTTKPSRTSGKTESDWSKNNDEQGSRGKQTEQRIGCGDVLRTNTNTYDNRTSGNPRENEGESEKERLQEWNEIQQFEKPNTLRSENAEVSTNTDNKLRQRRDESTQEGRQDKRKRAEPLGSNQPGRQSGNWENFPTQSPVCSRNDGISTKLDGAAIQDLLQGKTPREPWKPFGKWRNESIKAYGNAVVPQVVYQIFKAINEYERIAQFRP